MASANDNASTPVPFPQPDFAQPPQQPQSQPTPTSPSAARRSRTSTNASNTSVTNRVRTASIKLMEASPPTGMWAATGTVASKAPTLAEIRRGSFGSSGWNEEPQRHKAERRASQTSIESPVRPPMGKGTRSGSTAGALGTEPFPAVTEEEMSAYPPREPVNSDLPPQAPRYNYAGEKYAGQEPKPSSELTAKGMETALQETSRESGQYANGYVPPPKLPWTTSTVIGLKAFSKWFITPSGFLITLYGLNVVAWGGMLFLLLCNAAPAMCKPTCNHIQSPRRIWIEIDSQILNALFCVTGFGLAPWRFRDLYWWGWWRLGGSTRKETGIRRLAGVHRGWFRLPGSDLMSEHAGAATVSAEDAAVPIPHEKIPDPPPTGVRAPPTKRWKMDFVVWMNVWNTFFQIVLCVYMYRWNRHNRPSWATGTFVALGCIVAGAGGIMMYHEGKSVKKVEGVPMPEGGYKTGPTDAETQYQPLNLGPEGAARTIMVGV
ncbi:hypothetical protein BDV95DRAFT_15910 [Massariosphaeria phaeospora]|uniref:Uncharacterized protein n=1 Tax=Massariosphaeria phaeospora TaxID=100035 RepID=A0A7C8II65_9PLEO|nr:hypothetical protein BDV95DRAFT_15910 [Massariosphaeria phaeospora]